MQVNIIKYKKLNIENICWVIIFGHDFIVLLLKFSIICLILSISSKM